MKKPRLVIESHVPYVPDELGQYFDIERVAPEDITLEVVADADAMIIRTRTGCDARLLSDSDVRFIATATIGTDHIDRKWCENHGITIASAPGCNAPAVAQYVLASLLTLFPDGLEDKTLGVIGVGHVGSIVADWARQLGMKVLASDPPRARRNPSGYADVCGVSNARSTLDNHPATNPEAPEAQFVDTPLQELVSQSDIVTFHVPHTVGGEYPTHHLADASLFDMMRPGAVVVNSARGPVVNTPDLIAALESGRVSKAVIDCWEGEPDISQRLLQLAAIATPHIAGYSLNGKIRATMMAVNALCEYFGIDYRMEADIPTGAAPIVTPDAIKQSYNPLIDTRLLRQGVDIPDFAAHFEHLRNHYPLRPEVK